MEYGIFNDEGCVENGFYSFKAAADACAEGEYVAECCPVHSDQEREHCEECNPAEGKE